MKRNYKICKFCKKQISLSNYDRHIKSCSDKKSKIENFKTCDNKYKCPYCDKIYTKMGIYTHIWRSHGDGQNHDPNIGYQKDRIVWNKGLNSSSDDRIKKYSESIKEFYTQNTNHFKGKKHKKNSIKKMSEYASINNKGGKCKWYIVDNQKVQGTWERDLAKKMTKLNIKWEKINSLKYTFEYIKNNKKHRYTPDFYLEEYNLFLDPKGFWWGDDKNKIKLVTEQNNLLKTNLIIIEEEKFKLLLNCKDKNEFLDILMGR